MATSTTSNLGTTSATSGLGSTAGTAGTAGMYGKVVVTVKSAHSLLDKTWIGKADPYCEIKVADAEIQTNFVKNAGDHAVWDESFAFNNVAPDDVIEFNVYDHNRLRKDSLMGTGSLSMRQVFMEGKLETRVPLTSRTGTKEAGEIWVSLRSEDGAGLGTATTGTETGLSTTSTTTGTGAGYETAAVGGVTSGLAATSLEDRSLSTTSTASGVSGARGTTAAGYGTTAPVAGVATTGVETTGAVYQAHEPVVCGQQFFTKVEDRPVMKERVTVMKQHVPVEREYVVETRATGVEQQVGVEHEHLGSEHRIVSEAAPAPELYAKEFYTKTEDRPIVKERATLMKEHRPVEKEYVVETRATGVEKSLGREEEHVGSQDRVVGVTPPSAPEHNEEYFTKIEDRPVVKEVTQVMKEHRPIEKEYVTETRHTGVERETGLRQEEHLGTQHRIVAEAQPTSPCE
ncbi:hypothetical protein N2152v2_009176 [Parachlorella kessleri]